MFVNKPIRLSTFATLLSLAIFAGACIAPERSEKKFVVRVTDIRAGQALARGKTEPLTPQQAKKPDEKDEAAQK